MVYVISLPDFSLTFKVVFCSGFNTEGIVTSGSKTVFLLITSTGKIPYILIGVSFIVEACGFNNDI